MFLYKFPRLRKDTKTRPGRIIAASVAIKCSGCHGAKVCCPSACFPAEHCIGWIKTYNEMLCDRSSAIPWPDEPLIWGDCSSDSCGLSWLHCSSPSRTESAGAATLFLKIAPHPPPPHRVERVSGFTKVWIYYSHMSPLSFPLIPLFSSCSLSVLEMLTRQHRSRFTQLGREGDDRCKQVNSEKKKKKEFERERETTRAGCCMENLLYTWFFVQLPPL